MSSPRARNAEASGAFRVLAAAKVFGAAVLMAALVVTARPTDPVRANGTPLATSLTCTQSTTLVSYDGTVTILGSLSTSEGTLPDRTDVILFKSTNSGLSWRKEATAAYDPPSVAYRARTRLISNTVLHLSFGGDASHEATQSRNVLVRAQAWLPAPRTPSEVKAGAAFTVFGYLKPRHEGRTRLEFFRKTGDTWSPYRWVYAENHDFLSFTRYSLRYHLPSTGAWRVRARHWDAGHYRTVSAWRQFTVKPTRRPGIIFRVSTTKRVVALTFDDLYSAPRTQQILEILRRYGVKATFFPTGSAARSNPALMRAIVRDGHTIANHSYNHPVMPGLSWSRKRGEIVACERAVKAATRHTTRPYFRPPYGATNASVQSAAAAAGHPYVILWDVDTRDWASPGVGSIVGSVKRGARPGSIVLMHGGPPQTPSALPSILSHLKSRGLKMVTLPELLAAGGYS